MVKKGLEMITPSFSLTATERVLPKLTLDFTTASLDSRVTFTRTGNTATVTNASGYVASINANLPRFDYNPLTLVCKGLLIEESRSNLLTYSQALENSAWTFSAQNLTVTANAINSPDNTQNADALVETAANNYHYLVQSYTKAASAIQYSFSLYVKPSVRNWVFVTVFDGVSTGNRLWFNLSGAGSIGSNTLVGAGFTGVSYAISLVANGFYRITATFTTSLTTVLFIYPSLSTGNAVQTYAGTLGAIGVYAWGAQLEAGAFATSYIPTVAAAVTRNADVATMTGTNFSDWWYASEGAAVIQALPSTISNTRPAVRFDDNTANESIALRGVAADPQLFVVDGGSPQATLDAGTITANTAYKLGGAWKESSFATAINGAAAVTSASGTLPTVTQARLGSDGTNYLNGHLQNLRYWPQRLTNAEVQAFSK